MGIAAVTIGITGVNRHTMQYIQYVLTVLAPVLYLRMCGKGFRHLLKCHIILARQHRRRACFFLPHSPVSLILRLGRLPQLNISGNSN